MIKANRVFTGVLGSILLVLGVLGCVPQLLHPASPMDNNFTHDVMFNYGELFNAFPMNVPLAIILMGMGAGGILASVQTVRSRLYERAMFTIAIVFLFASLMPLGISKVWGLLPLFGWNVAIWLGIAMFSFYFAFVEGPLMPSINQPVRHA